MSQAMSQTLQEEKKLDQEEKPGRKPLLMHFSKTLPPATPTAGVTARDSGGTTGSAQTGEDANIDYD